MSTFTVILYKREGGIFQEELRRTVDLSLVEDLLNAVGAKETTHVAYSNSNGLKPLDPRVKIIAWGKKDGFRIHVFPKN